ncbi:hypothetical protein Tco_0594402, partial [Tanacetum coccineum]
VVAAAAAMDGVVEGVGGCRRRRWCCMSSVGASGGVKRLPTAVEDGSEGGSMMKVLVVVSE